MKPALLIFSLICFTVGQPIPQPGPVVAPEPYNPYSSDYYYVPTYFAPDQIDVTFSCDQCFDPFAPAGTPYSCAAGCFTADCNYRGLINGACNDTNPVITQFCSGTCDLTQLFNDVHDRECMNEACFWDGAVPYSRPKAGEPGKFDNFRTILDSYSACSGCVDAIMADSCDLASAACKTGCPIIKEICAASTCATYVGTGGICYMDARPTPQQLSTVCKNSTCTACPQVASKCPVQKGGKSSGGATASTSGDFISEFCSPGCSTDMLVNGICDEACMTFACRYDWKDCPGKTCSGGAGGSAGSSALWVANVTYFISADNPYRDCQPYSMYTPYGFYDVDFINLTPLAQGVGSCQYELYYDYLDPLDFNSFGIVLTVAYYVENGQIHVAWSNASDSGDYDPNIGAYVGNATYFDASTCGPAAGAPAGSVASNSFSYIDGICQVLPIGIPGNTGARGNTGVEFAIQLFGAASMGVPATRACLWGEVGDGVCDSYCQLPECFNDFTDCTTGGGSLTTNPCPSTCNVKNIGDGVCDDACYTQDCDFDGGDCWCAPNCPEYLLFNDACDTDCNTDSCYRDFFTCVCSANCFEYMQGDGRCDTECNVEDCAFDSGDCVGEGVEDVEYLERSLFKAIFYPQTWENDDCPDFEKSQEFRKIYDFGEYKRDKWDRPEHKFRSGWETSGEPKYYDRCYSSYRFGHFMATWDNPERSLTNLFFNCSDGSCGGDDHENCNSIVLENDKCLSVDGITVKITWENSAVSFSSSILVLVCFLAFFHLW